MQIFIRDQKTFSLSINQGSTILDIKRIYIQRNNITYKRSYLFFNILFGGKILENKGLAIKYLKENDTIYIHWKLHSLRYNRAQILKVNIPDINNSNDEIQIEYHPFDTIYDVKKEIIENIYLKTNCFLDKNKINLYYGETKLESNFRMIDYIFSKSCIHNLKECEINLEDFFYKNTYIIESGEILFNNNYANNLNFNIRIEDNYEINSKEYKLHCKFCFNELLNLPLPCLCCIKKNKEKKNSIPIILPCCRNRICLGCFLTGTIQCCNNKSLFLKNIIS